jgi:hypothetical protein
MQYVKTQGIGFGFTENKSEAMQFPTVTAAGRMRERLKKQFREYAWEILADADHFYLVVHSAGEAVK